MTELEEDQWLLSRREEVAQYLQRQGLSHGAISAKPSWYVAPYASMWQVESVTSPGRVGWWAVCGDHPTDYISSTDIDEPREVLRAIGARWEDVSSCMRAGVPHPTITIGNRENAKELGELLARRAGLFLQFAADDEIWNGESS